jgi:uncharacterized RDD family membrane protein YckC
MNDSLLARRSIAALIDVVICCLLFALIFHVFADRRPMRGGQIIYYPFTESCFARTLGKLICGVSVRSVRQGDLTLGQCLLRRLLDPLELWLTFGIVGWLAILASPAGQRLGDRLGDTEVERDRPTAKRA